MHDLSIKIYIEHAKKYRPILIIIYYIRVPYYMNISKQNWWGNVGDRICVYIFCNGHIKKFLIKILKNKVQNKIFPSID